MTQAPVVPTAPVSPKRPVPTVPASMGANVLGGSPLPEEIDLSRFRERPRRYNALNVPDDAPKDTDLRYVVATPERIAEVENQYYKVVLDGGKSKVLKSGISDGKVQKMILVGRDKRVSAMANRERALSYVKRRNGQLSSKSVVKDDSGGALLQEAESSYGFTTT